MPTLFCQAGQHSWERPPQRGRQPLNCPEHRAPSGASAPAAAQATREPVDQEIVDLYAENRPAIARFVIEAFVDAGTEPPEQDTITLVGFSAKQSATIEEYLKRTDATGSRAQNASIDAELGDV